MKTIGDYISWILKRAFTILIFSLIYSCNSTPQEVKDIQNHIGQRILFDRYEAVTKDGICSTDMPVGKKVIICFKQNACVDCELSILHWWGRQEKMLGTTPVIPIIYANETDDVIAALKKVNYSGVVYVDRQSRFLKANHMQTVLARNRTFLVDENNKIIVMGEPFNNESLWKLYQSRLNPTLSTK